MRGIRLDACYERKGAISRTINKRQTARATPSPETRRRSSSPRHPPDVVALLTMDGRLRIVLHLIFLQMASSAESHFDLIKGRGISLAGLGLLLVACPAALSLLLLPVMTLDAVQIQELDMPCMIQCDRPKCGFEQDLLWAAFSKDRARRPEEEPEEKEWQPDQAPARPHSTSPGKILLQAFFPSGTLHPRRESVLISRSLPAPGCRGKRSKPSSNPFTPGHLFPDNLLWKPRHRSRKIQSRFPPNPSPATVPQRNSMRSSRDPTIRLPARGVSTRPVAVQARKEKIHSEIAEQGGTETDNR